LIAITTAAAAAAASRPFIATFIAIVVIARVIVMNTSTAC
jgi:hypothetical protein